MRCGCLCGAAGDDGTGGAGAGGLVFGWLVGFLSFFPFFVRVLSRCYFDDGFFLWSALSSGLVTFVLKTERRVADLENVHRWIHVKENQAWIRWKMDVPYWLAVVNTGLAIALWCVS